MAASVITSSTAASVIFGATAETGIILSSFSRSVQSQKAELMDEDGDIVAVSHYGRTATISIAGAINGSSGVATATIGGLLTLANATTEFGVTGGYVGAPVLLGKGGIEKIYDIAVSPDEAKAIQVAGDAVKELVAATPKG